MIVLFCFSGCSFGDMMENLYYKLASSNEVYMFESIDELENMEALFEKYGQVERYSEQDDEYLQDLKYINKYLAKYECESYEFEIYAYEFETIEQAHQYYTNSNYLANYDDETPHKRDNIWRLYSNSMGTIYIIAINEFDIYRITYEKKNEDEINELLSSHLKLEMIVCNDGVPGYTFECIKNDKTG